MSKSLSILGILVIFLLFIAINFWYRYRAIDREVKVSTCMVETIKDGGFDDHGQARYSLEQARKVCEFKL